MTTLELRIAKILEANLASWELEDLEATPAEQIKNLIKHAVELDLERGRSKG